MLLNTTPKPVLDQAKAAAMGTCKGKAVAAEITAKTAGQDPKAAYNAAYKACMKEKGYPQGK